MKKILLLPLLILSVLCYSQAGIAISALPANTDPADSALVPGFIAGTTKKILGKDLSRSKLDSVRVRNDSLFYYKWSGSEFFAGISGGLFSFNGRVAPAVVPQGSDYAGFYPLMTSTYSFPTWIDSLDWHVMQNVPDYITAVTSATPTTLPGLLAGSSAGRMINPILRTPLSYSVPTNTFSILTANAFQDGAVAKLDWSHFNAAYSWGNHALMGYLTRDSLPDDSTYLLDPMFTILGLNGNMDSAGVFFSSDTTNGVITILQKHQYDTAYQKFTKSGTFAAGTITFTRNDNTTWQVTGLGAGGSGGVSSVDMTVPSWLTVAGNPITTSGTLAVTATAGQTANRFLATPNGSTGAVGLRAIVAADIPVLDASKITTGSLSTAVVATGTATNTYIPISNGSGGIVWGAQPTGTIPSQTGHSGQFLTTDGVNASWVAGTAAALTQNQIGVGNGSNQLSGATTFTWNGTIMGMGSTAGSGSTTATPVTLDMGSTYSNANGGNTKLQLFHAAGSGVTYGIGVSPQQMDYVISDALGDHVFYTNGAADLVIKNNGTVRPLKGFAIHRVTVADANYTALATDHLIAYTSLSVTRNVTLPAASSMQAGQFLIIKDESGNASSSVKINIVGTVDGQVNPTAIQISHDSYKIYSSGSSFYTIK